MIKYSKTIQYCIVAALGLMLGWEIYVLGKAKGHYKSAAMRAENAVALAEEKIASAEARHAEADRRFEVANARIADADSIIKRAEEKGQEAQRILDGLNESLKATSSLQLTLEERLEEASKKENELGIKESGLIRQQDELEKQLELNRQLEVEWREAKSRFDGRGKKEEPAQPKGPKYNDMVIDNLTPAGVPKLFDVIGCFTSSTGVEYSVMPGKDLREIVLKFFSGAKGKEPAAYYADNPRLLHYEMRNALRSLSKPADGSSNPEYDQFILAAKLKELFDVYCSCGGKDEEILERLCTHEGIESVIAEEILLPDWVLRENMVSKLVKSNVPLFKAARDEKTGIMRRYEPLLSAEENAENRAAIERDYNAELKAVDDAYRQVSGVAEEVVRLFRNSYNNAGALESHVESIRKQELHAFVKTCETLLKRYDGQQDIINITIERERFEHELRESCITYVSSQIAQAFSHK